MLWWCWKRFSSIWWGGQTSLYIGLRSAYIPAENIEFLIASPFDSKVLTASIDEGNLMWKSNTSYLSLYCFYTLRKSFINSWLFCYIKYSDCYSYGNFIWHSIRLCRLDSTALMQCHYSRPLPINILGHFLYWVPSLKSTAPDMMIHTTSTTASKTLRLFDEIV